MQLRLAPLAIFASLGLASHAFAADKGFELMARPGYGSGGAGSPIGSQDAQVGGGTARFGDAGAIWSGTSSPWGGGFRGEATVGYRFIPMLSVGLGVGLRSASGSDPGDGSTRLSRAAFGIEVGIGAGRSIGTRHTKCALAT
ncbi:MAG: hypothetical protein NVSMB47_11890 [Polyangiales bacterium]